MVDNNPKVLTLNWLAPARLANRLALERSLEMTTATVYKRYAWYVAGVGAAKLAGRLLYLEQRGLLHLLVPKKDKPLREWRRERGLPASRRALGEPPYISVSNVCTLTPKHFAGLVEAASRSTESIGTCSSGNSSNSSLTDLESFLADLPTLPAWEQLWKAAEAESERLLKLLPADLQQAAAADGSESNSEEEASS